MPDQGLISLKFLDYRDWQPGADRMRVRSPSLYVLAPLSEGWDGVVPGLPIGDTLKRVGSDGGVEETVPRDGLWAVQTPQAFAAQTLRRAQAIGVEATDCAGLVELAGGRVKVVEGDPRLLKVTSETDLETVAGWR